MLTFKEIYEAYKETGIMHCLFEQLVSENKVTRETGMALIRGYNFQTKDDVKLFVALEV